MWKAILVWLGKQIAKAAAEELSKRVAEKKELALLAIAEAQRLQAVAQQHEQEAAIIEQHTDNPFKLLGV